MPLGWLISLRDNYGPAFAKTHFVPSPTNNVPYETDSSTPRLVVVVQLNAVDIRQNGAIGKVVKISGS